MPSVVGRRGVVEDGAVTDDRRGDRRPRTWIGTLTREAEAIEQDEASARVDEHLITHDRATDVAVGLEDEERTIGEVGDDADRRSDLAAEVERLRNRTTRYRARRARTSGP